MMKKEIVLSLSIKWILVVGLLLPFSGLKATHLPGKNPANWPSYNRTNASDRFSPLKQISKRNVSGLQLVNSFEVPGQVNLQTGPLVIDGVMYLTTDTVTYAIDAVTAAVKWEYKRPHTPAGGNKTNRGAAYYDGKVIRGADDVSVFALDAETGGLLWEKPLDIAPRPGASVSMAPVAWNGLVFIGNAGGDQAGVTGHVYAFDVNTGEQVWRFDAVPESSWPDWEYNGIQLPVTGGCFWTSFSIDEKEGVLYVTAGNPAPDFDIELRRGENLYTNCIIALNARTGQLVAYNQVVKNDFHDWDITCAPVLVTNKAGRKIAASANKDGLLTVLDRSAVDTGTTGGEERLPFIFSVPITVRENVDVPLSREEYTWFKPGITGGAEWNGTAYHPELDILYTGSVDWGARAKLLPIEQMLNNLPEEGELYFGGDVSSPEFAESRGWFYAVDASTGSVIWNYQTPSPVWAGITPTAGGLVFGAAYSGEVYAFDAATGSILWQGDTGMANGGGLVTYAVKGKQYVAVVCGFKSAGGKTGDVSPDSKVMIYAL